MKAAGKELFNLIVEVLLVVVAAIVVVVVPQTRDILVTGVMTIAAYIGGVVVVAYGFRILKHVYPTHPLAASPASLLTKRGEDALIPGEKAALVVRGHPLGLIALPRDLAGSMKLAVYFGLVVLYGGAATIGGWPLVIAVLLPPIWIAARIPSWWHRQFIITPTRVMMSWGIWSDNKPDMEMRKITDKDFKVHWHARLLKFLWLIEHLYGDVHIDTASQEVFQRLLCIAQVGNIRGIINALTVPTGNTNEPDDLIE